MNTFSSQKGLVKFALMTYRTRTVLPAQWVCEDSVSTLRVRQSVHQGIHHEALL